MSTEARQRAKLLAKSRVEKAERDRSIDVNKECFGPQKLFVLDESPFKTAVCSRRAGKTHGDAIEVLDSAIRKPRAPSLYFTITRGDAKRIIWPTLLEINRNKKLGLIPNEADLVLKHQNGRPAVVLLGINTRAEIEKMRGTPWGKAVGDEAQAFPEYIESLVEDVLTPSFVDYNGSLSLTGTPAPVPVGYYYDRTRDPEWSHHDWTVFQNPHIHNPQAWLDKVLKRRGITKDHPSIQREWYGRWVHDPSALVFQYDEDKNHYAELPGFLGKWWYVIGIDLGFEDADAVAVLAWNEHSNAVWLTEEHIQQKQDITSLAEQVIRVRKRLGESSVRAITIDTGGIGKKVAEELSARHGLPVVAAEKKEKQVHIELLNDALRTQRFFARKDTRFVKDSYLVEWDNERSTPDRRWVSERFHSDILDAVLYAYRACLAWTSVVPVEGPVRGTPAFEEAWQKDAFQRTMRDVERQSSEKYRAQMAEIVSRHGPIDWGTEE